MEVIKSVAGPRTRPAHRVIIACCALMWCVGMVVGFRVLGRYSTTPGVAATAPDQWPLASKLERPDGLPVLVMLVHPRCSCSRASLGELAEIMERARGRVTARVLFVKPAGAEADWEQTDLWRRASSMAGVRVVTDDAAREAALFGAKTSGQALLYDKAGRLLFSGGITAARAHAGDNLGRSEVLALLEGDSAGASSPVFGCPLADREDTALR